MFAFVLQTPPQFVKDALSAYVSFDNDTATSAGNEEKPSVRQGRKARPAQPRPVPVASQPDNVPEVRVQEISFPTHSAQHTGHLYVFRVASDGTELYSLNSANGTVVGVLQKGDLVEPQLEINAAGQTWAFVNVTEHKISGFLPRNSFERQQLGQIIQ